MENKITLITDIPKGSVSFSELEEGEWFLDEDGDLSQKVGAHDSIWLGGDSVGTRNRGFYHSGWGVDYSKRKVLRRVNVEITIKVLGAS